MTVNKKSLNKIDWEKVNAIPQESYDYDEAPELTEEMMKIAFLRKPINKKPITLRLDDDLIEFFKKTSGKYQTKINDVLRAYKIAYEKVHP